MDKYEVTSGRIRQFLEALSYDVRTWAFAQFDANLTPTTQAGQMLLAQLPINQAGVKQNTLNYLPQTADTGAVLNAVVQTGALVLDTSGDQGCFTNVGAGGAATYWWNEPTIHAMAGSPARPFTQDYYDIKPMNCIPYFLAAAFCAWDGGRLPTAAEHKAAWGGAQYPWGGAMLPNPYPGNQAITSDAACAGGSVTCTVDWFDGGQLAGSQGDFYYYPSYVGSVPNALVPDSLGNTLDLTPYIAAPGRFFLDVTTNRSASFGDGEGWQDLGADMIEWTQPTGFTGPQTFCDESGVLGPGESYNCTNTGGHPNDGVVRGTSLPMGNLAGGSWEGHGIVEALTTTGWSFYRQYGKTGLRCVRPAEPAP